MTTANKITLARIALIPVFVILAALYGKSVASGTPNEALRWWAVAAFGIASVSDGLDGWVARNWNQRTELGVILDPVADKGLLLAGIVTLSFSPWVVGLPLWLAILIIARDLAVLAGSLALILLEGKVAVRPTWTGKTATALQMTTLIFVMLEFQQAQSPISLGNAPLGFAAMDLLIWCTAAFTTASCVGYWARGVAEVHQAGHGKPVPWPKKGALPPAPVPERKIERA
ncbi:MAG: CDP-alcohol phosphatidyltransferase family protein [Verrucomicrobia bacterium]|nr:CDP-alcohol phosphatidyltransferase family protein [Verrucomicrobiota bacterium]